MITHFGVVVAVLVGILTMLSVTATCVRWVYKQGAASAEQIIATRANTRATEELSASLGVFTQKTDGTITDHEKRITRLEAHEDTRGRQGHQP